MRWIDQERIEEEVGGLREGRERTFECERCEETSLERKMSGRQIKEEKQNKFMRKRKEYKMKEKNSRRKNTKKK